MFIVVIYFISVLISIVLSVVLVMVNLIGVIQFLFKKSTIQDYMYAKKFDLKTISLGVFSTVSIWFGFSFREYYEAIELGIDSTMLHTPISEAHIVSVLLPLILGYGAYYVIRLHRDKLSPLIHALSLSFILMANLVGVLLIVQFSNQFFLDASGEFTYFSNEMLLALLPINFLFLSYMLLMNMISEHSNIEYEYKNRVLDALNRFVIRAKNIVGPAMVFLMPLYTIVLVILTIFGQKPDSVIRAFTETSDWTLSQQVSPPMVEVERGGHYLCTVSLRGHKSLVKPLRYGLRHGNKILVNRQLMIANAFEELIQVRFPKSHKVIRNVYDNYGYPLSDLITTEFRADFMYILMKPLEYIFLLLLYIMDRKPENRIASQYLPISVRKSIAEHT